MGLDMHLMEDGTNIEIAYWRKHPNLHGFIVNEFANGVDECPPIPLDIDAVKKIISATQENRLPHTEGFFFGKSYPEDKEPTIEAFTKVLNRMTQDPTYKVYYQASW